MERVGLDEGVDGVILFLDANLICMCIILKVSFCNLTFLNNFLSDV